MHKGRCQKAASQHLSHSLNQRLNHYALAAGAAGVGFLACVQPAESEIIYTSVNYTIDAHHSYALDLNHDGIVDFTIFESIFGSPRVSVKRSNRNEMVCFADTFKVCQNSTYSYAPALPKGLQSDRTGDGEASTDLNKWRPAFLLLGEDRSRKAHGEAMFRTIT